MLDINKKSNSKSVAVELNITKLSPSLCAFFLVLLLFFIPFLPQSLAAPALHCTAQN